MRMSANSTTKLVRLSALSLMVVAALAMASGLTGCRGERSGKRPRQILPDLDHQPKYQAQQKSAFFGDFAGGGHGEAQNFGRTQREPIVGAVAFGAKPWTRSFEGIDFTRRGSYLQADPAVYEGVAFVRSASGQVQYDDDGAPQTQYLDYMPIEQILGVPTSSPDFDARFDELLALGRENFNIYCIVCHGATGRGDGMVGRRWATPLPSWHDAKYQRGGETGQDGYIFHTLLYGLPNEGDNVPYPFRMRGYKNKVSRHEAWGIVAYIRSLQAARSGAMTDVPNNERPGLTETREAAIRAQQAARPTREEEATP